MNFINNKYFIQKKMNFINNTLSLLTILFNIRLKSVHVVLPNSQAFVISTTNGLLCFPSQEG